MKKILLTVMLLLTAGLLLPNAVQAQCVPNPLPNSGFELGLGQSYCIRVCPGLMTFTLVGTVSGLDAVPVLTTVAGCNAANTDCDVTCTPVDPPHIFTLGGGHFFADPTWYGGWNNCLEIVYHWVHDPGYWEIQIFSFCQGCFCLTFEDQLAAELSDISAVSGNGAVQLNWTTASESNVAHFNVLRDNVKMAEISATNTATGHSYRWTDANLVNDVTYTYTLETVNMDGSTEFLGATSATPRSGGEAVVSEYALYQNFPNPFNPETSIRFDLVEASNVSLRVYNLLGQEVATLVNGQQSAGSHVVNFDASNLTTGMYIYRLDAGEFSATRKMMLIK